MDEFPYEMLEELKDGKPAESTKYNSIKLQVNTPNTVLVFALMKILIKKECRKIDGLFISLEEGFYFIAMDIKFNRIIVLL